MTNLVEIIEKSKKQKKKAQSCCFMGLLKILRLHLTLRVPRKICKSRTSIKMSLKRSLLTELLDLATNKSMRWIPLVLLFLWIQPVAAFDLTEFGTLNLTPPLFQSQSDPSLQASAGVSFGGGISVGFEVYPQFDLETGLLIVPFDFSTTSSSNFDQTYSLNMIQIPLMIRYRWLPHISVGAGVYWAKVVGAVSVDSVSTSYNDLFWSNSNVGLIASFRYKTPINEVISLVLEERLAFGTSNLDTSGTQTFVLRQLQTCIGIGMDL